MKLGLKKKLKNNILIRNTYFLLQGTKYFLRFDLIMLIKKYIWFFKQYKNFSKIEENKRLKHIEWYPCLFDNLSHTPIEPTYFFQDSWAAKHIFKLNPKHHYDVGSSASTIGILSQFTPITMIDIRPIELELENLFFIKGSILELPIEDNMLETISSLCVVEHIGLGRYGDQLNQFGSEKAINELKRVTRIDGVILISLPVDNENKIYFNAHRAFTREYILELFDGFELLEEKYQYGLKMYNNYDKCKGFGTGMYMFKKREYN